MYGFEDVSAGARQLHKALSDGPTREAKDIIDGLLDTSSRYLSVPG